MGTAESAPLSDLVTRVRVTHHVTTRVLLLEIGRAVARIAVTVPLLANAELHRAFAYFRDDLLAHLLEEERTLFPHVIGLEQAEAGLGPEPHAAFHSIASPIQLMKNEKEHVQRLLARLEIDVAAARATAPSDVSWTALETHLRALHEDLTEHARIEEDELFPAALELEHRLLAKRLSSLPGPPSGR